MRRNGTRGTYIGTREDLKGKTASLMQMPQGWRAQFDDATLKVDPNGADVVLEGPDVNTSNSLGYAWHGFFYRDFEIDNVITP